MQATPEKMLPMPYQFDMSAADALKELNRQGLIPRRQCKTLLALIEAQGPYPAWSVNALELVFLMQTRPLTPSVH